MQLLATQRNLLFFSGHDVGEILIEGDIGKTLFIRIGRDERYYAVSNKTPYKILIPEAQKNKKVCLFFFSLLYTQWQEK